MALSLTETQMVADLAQFVYDFLPGTPFGDSSVSFPGVAHTVGLADFWQGGSKLPAIRALLEATLEARRNRFCKLMIGIVQKGIAYRSKKKNPLTRDDIRRLNDIIAKLQFKIPELWDPKFLDSLPHAPSDTTERVHVPPNLGELKEELYVLESLHSTSRGFAFEKFLNKLFDSFDLKPRRSFRLVGEQIDGSFELDHETYLLEAKWQAKQTCQSDLLILREKVEGKAKWSRGLFVSYSGFSDDGLEAFSRGRATNLIGMSGQDIYFVLEGTMSLTEAFRRKIRIAGETGQFYVPVQELTLIGDQ